MRTLNFRFFSRVRLAVLLAGGLPGGAAFAQEKEPPTQVPDLTPTQWREDLRYVAAELPKTHKNAFHLISREKFAQQVADLDRRIPQLQDHEVVVGIQELAASIGDGHTFLGTWEVFHFYPVELYWFGPELRVVRVAPGYERALGTRVLKIGKYDVSEARKRINRLVPQGENDSYKLHQEVGQFVRAEDLHALSLTPEVTKANFTLQADGGKPFVLPMQALKPGTRVQWRNAAAQPPLYEQLPDSGFTYTYRPASRMVYVNFRWYDDIERHARQLFDFVDQHQPEKLVFDLRQNGGGNFTLPQKFILPEILKRPKLNQKGRLFVLVGRRTFSAAMTNAIDFRKQTQALLVGEPIRARPNGYQENGWLTLPNSGLRMSVSTLYYQFVEQDVPAVLPDQAIPLTWQDYKAGHDPVLKWVENK